MTAGEPTAEAPQPAPEFPAGLTWFGIRPPPRLHVDLQGHVVVLLFWTPSCVHSRQVLRDLAYLEQRFADRPLLVLSVLGARHAGERQQDTALAALRRLQVLHPVAHDQQASFWSAWNCRVWPTLAVVDACGRLRFQAGGEVRLHALAAAVEALLGEAEAAGAAAPEPLRNAPDRGPLPATGLYFPARLCVDAGSGLLWVADTGHHRILGVDPDSGAVCHVAGSGLPGDSDGPMAEACFWFPHGLAVQGERVLVADTGNHRLRAIHLPGGQVETLLGSGHRGRDLAGGRFGEGQDLHSPTDLQVHDGTVYFTNAGTHQLWAFDPQTRAGRALFGTGAQGLHDGDAEQALLSQPAGLAADHAELLLADAGGALRSVDLDHMVVHTLSGAATGGPPALAFPQAVVLHGAEALVCDPARDRILRVDRSTGTVAELVGPGAGLRWPAGLAIAGDRLWIADTGNHRILALDLAAAGAKVRELCLVDVPSPREPFAGPPPQRPEVALQSGEGVPLRVALALPPGAVLHPECPVSLRLEDPSGAALATDVDQSVEGRDGEAFLDWLPLGAPGRSELLLELRYQSQGQPGASGHRQVLRRRQPVLLAAAGHPELVVD